MTPTDNDLTIIRPRLAPNLVVRDPSGKTRIVPLLTGEMTIGRGPDNALVLDQADHSASRHHAAITVDGPVVVVTDRGSTNGVLVNGERVERAAITSGDEVQMGKTVLWIEAAAAPSASASPPGQCVPPPGVAKKPRSSRVVLYLAALAVLLLFLGLALFSGDDEPQPQPASEATAPAAAPAGEVPPSDAGAPQAVPDATSSATAPAGEPGKAAPVVPDSAVKAGGAAAPESAAPPAPPPADTSAVSAEAAEKSLDHARQGMFFYNSGKIGLAVAEWEKAVTLDPKNGQAAKWLARAEGELDQLVDKHYREGLAAEKYSRRDEALNHFRFVAEHCRDRADERCLDAARHLGQLEGKKP
ncbi:FHA domain-containing protein [Desulfolutivibrio sulfoxidireducens]|uniref:FHA domain-containing protein n=1 Tax=Desulfolutivibrio sulfoxidireducens TaxID=2773299 RepID=UPI00159DF9F9|nr:FHA domain-containing protein [Desulfolutivibrio sulfoxidireducens]QLA14666.1 FHA domain-containing protein [Desulfolutivibrio sulfoxidireducens]QLA18247.1 FHA domain-containing protein [Desulfolutivibrio sulfoxidireducens]